MSRAHILVVDDEPAILTTLQKTLTLEGYGVDVAGGIRIAEEKLKKRSYDLCLFDVSLPDGDGLDLLSKLRESKETAQTPVLVMSGHATLDAAIRATRLGALNFLEKPLNTDALLVMIETALRLVRAESEARALRVATIGTGELVGESESMKRLAEQIARAAKSAASVLVTGERGTGKELVARAIHQLSPRAKGPLEKLNCAALPHELIESELFGHEAGAFTGATKQRRGKFERASGGTLFLDEVGDMPLAMQSKLLRVLQEREIERVGGNETIKVDTRVVAATNRDLVGRVRDEGSLPRGSVRPAERRSAAHPAAEGAQIRTSRCWRSTSSSSPRRRTTGRNITHRRQARSLALAAYSFPGNVRELRNLLERLVILTPDDVIKADDVRACLTRRKRRRKRRGYYRPGVPFRVLVEEAERTILTDALTHNGGQMAATARGLDLERSHLYKKTRALGLRGEKDDGEES